MNPPGREAEIQAAMRALCRSLAAGDDPDETIDRTELHDLLAGRLAPAAEKQLFDRLALSPDVRESLAGLRYSSADREIARQVGLSDGASPETSGLDPLGVSSPPIYYLDGPHGGRGDHTFGPGDRVEIIARPDGQASNPPPLSLWAGPRSGPMRKVENATIQRDEVGVYRVLFTADTVFFSPGRWRLVVVLGDEMAPSRAEVTESMVQVLQSWVVYAPSA